MPCKRRRTATRFTRDDITGDLVDDIPSRKTTGGHRLPETVAPVVRGKEYVEVNFNVKTDNWDCPYVLPGTVVSSGTGDGYYGYGCGIKFDDCVDTSVQGVEDYFKNISNFEKGWETKLDVPRILDVQVVEEDLPKDGKYTLTNVGRVYADEGDDGQGGKKGEAIPYFAEARVHPTQELETPARPGYMAFDKGVPVWDHKLEEKYGKNYVKLICTKRRLPALLDDVNECTYSEWRKMCQKHNPIWSQLNVWIVTEFNTVGQSGAKYKLPGDGVDSELAEAYYVDGLSKSEAGHYITYTYNLTDHLAEKASIPNDYYTDGFCLSLLSKLRTTSDTRWFNSYHLKLRIFYERSSVTLSSIFLSSRSAGMRQMEQLLKDESYKEFYAATGEETAPPADGPTNGKIKDKVQLWWTGRAKMYGLDLMKLKHNDAKSADGYCVPAHRSGFQGEVFDPKGDFDKGLINSVLGVIGTGTDSWQSKGPCGSTDLSA